MGRDQETDRQYFKRRVREISCTRMGIKDPQIVLPHGWFYRGGLRPFELIDGVRVVPNSELPTPPVPKNR